MFATLRRVTQRRAARLPSATRCFATETSLPAATESEERNNEELRQRYNEFLERKAKEPPLRPQLKIETKENHGLYAFFRKVPVDGGASTIYETVEANNKVSTKLGMCPVTLSPAL